MEYERMTHVGQVRSCIAGAAGIAITSQAAVSSDFLTTEGLTGLPLSDNRQGFSHRRPDAKSLVYLRGDSATEYQQSCSKLAESESIVLSAQTAR
jgi:hypothetical protein